ncbi:MAG: D-alanyl-D-alanine carboxypeptidase family protein [Saprospiraceae bacterium]|jgi:predicted chitinase|nr:D-alanyl-D-alanine carboxypeptidase family protein [Saprospiraceae bacterium]
MRDTMFSDREMEHLFEQLLSEFEAAPAPVGGRPSVLSEDRSVPGLTQYVNIDLGMATSRSGRAFRLNPTTAIYFPPAFRPGPYDVVLYLHGHKGKYPGDTVWIDGYLDGSRFPFFALREEVRSARGNLIFVAPTLGPHSQAGMLEKTGGFDRYIEQVAQAVDARYRRSLPRPQRIYLAAHSGGGSPMRRIVFLKDQFALRVQECWGFDSLYGGVSAWRQWAKSNPDKRLYVYYLGSTEQYAKDLQKNSPPNVQVQRSSKGHFWVPKLHLQERIRGIGAGEREFEWDWEFEALNPFGEKGGGRIQNKKDPAPADLDTIARAWGNRQVPIHRAAKAVLERMIAAARTDGIPHPQLLPTSAYRSFDEQQKLWEAGLKKRNGDAAENRKWVAPPGHSAHQSGRAVDLYLGVKTGSKYVAEQKQTPAYKWLVQNAERFGFYPYKLEPWHWEYNPPAGGNSSAPAAQGGGTWQEMLLRFAYALALSPSGLPVALAQLASVFSKGFPDENKITDILFYAKYPDAPRELKTDHPLAKEWVRIRNEVRRLKQSGTTPAQSSLSSIGAFSPITGEQLRRLGTGKDDLEKMNQIAQAINEYAPRFGINTPLRMAHFLGQTSHETDNYRIKTEGLTYTTPERLMKVWPKRFPSLASAQPFVRNPEALGDKVYGGRLGNTRPGDGYRFRGRGAIQITGKENYEKFTVWYRKHIQPGSTLDFVQQPELVADLPFFILTAVWFFSTRGLNELADQDDNTTISKKINGSTRTAGERLKRVQKAKSILGIGN